VKAVSADNVVAELRRLLMPWGFALLADRGSYLGYVRLVGRRQGQAKLTDHIVSLPAQYTKKPLLRSE
jgi:hypothetical protein